MRIALDGAKAGKETLKARLRQAPGGRGAAVEAAVRRGRPFACGSQEIVAPEDDDQRAEQGECPAAQACEGIPKPDRDAGSAACEASRDRGSAVEGAVRPQEREAGDAALRAPARPAARAPGHGRTQRPGLEERTEELKPPEEARVCSCCGKAYVANGVDESTLVEIEVKAHKRVIRRPRWRRTCGCASSPIEVSAPPAPRLFPRTLYGTSFWARFLFEHCACFRLWLPFISSGVHQERRPVRRHW